ncbi:MAG: hypothetical protein ACYDCK_06365 [Thermoplasmatota archaeon]
MLAVRFVSLLAVLIALPLAVGLPVPPPLPLTPLPTPHACSENVVGANFCIFTCSPGDDVFAKITPLADIGQGGAGVSCDGESVSCGWEAYAAAGRDASSPGCSVSDSQFGGSVRENATGFCYGWTTSVVAVLECGARAQPVA